jgi:hypothetical protein
MLSDSDQWQEVNCLTPLGVMCERFLVGELRNYFIVKTQTVLLWKFHWFPDTVESCTAVSGPSRGLSCVFPFRHYGNTFFNCTQSKTSKPWCPTTLNIYGQAIAGDWGFCHDDCPKETRKSPGYFPSFNYHEF